ncbi:MAG: nucleotidyl transferase AbiEii/AbiGii toxin family protein [Deltaproteobacteria bacterium]|nr:nucleotidyl transferase AbiEii/AbiGii toxin family protein [Deltaproteobacteria bacterium]
MRSPTGVKRHNVIGDRLWNAIVHFFAVQDWRGLFLTGGTCIAEFYFGHRVSIDIDLFTADRALFTAARNLLQQPDFFPGERVELVRSFPDFSQFLLHYRGHEPLKLDLVFDHPPAVGEKLCVDRIWIDSLPDLVANKLGCIINRNEVKDYLDLFYLLPAINLPPAELLALGQRKDAGLDALVLAYQLRYIQTVPTAPPYFLANVPWPHVQASFQHLHDALLDDAKALSVRIV